jgi:hypothetical protein
MKMLRKKNIIAWFNVWFDVLIFESEKNEIGGANFK